MESRGRIESITQDFRTKEYLVTLRIPDLPIDLENKDLDVKIVPHRVKRSLDANAMLWACVGDIARATKTDKDSVYTEMLKRYGSYVTLSACVEAYQELAKSFRIVDILGTFTNIDGTQWATFGCYYGSSLFDSREMSRLIDGVLSEMNEIGINTPPSADMKRALEKWEEMNG